MSASCEECCRRGAYAVNKLHRDRATIYITCVAEPLQAGPRLRRSGGQVGVPRVQSAGLPGSLVDEAAERPEAGRRRARLLHPEEVHQEAGGPHQGRAGHRVLPQYRPPAAVGLHGQVQCHGGLGDVCMYDSCVLNHVLNEYFGARHVENWSIHVICMYIHVRMCCVYEC